MRQLGPERGVAAETESVRAKIPKLPAFEDGKDDLDAFLQRFERFATSNGWKETTWASTLSALLNGTALKVYSRLSDDDARDYEKVKEALMKRYNLTEDGFRAKFRHNQPEKGESPGQFLVRLTKYVDRWVDLSKTTRDYESLRDMFVREQFMEACPTDLATHLRERAPQSMKEMAEMAQHFLEAHRRKLATRVDTVEFQNPGDARVVKKCYNCNSPEHLARACPQVRQPIEPSQGTSLYANNGKVTGYEYEGEVEGTPVTMLLDTGSTQTFVHNDLVHPMKIMPDAQGGIKCIHGDIQNYPTAKVAIKVGNTTYALKAKVSQNLPRPVILGRDIPNLAKLVLTAPTHKFGQGPTSAGDGRIASNNGRAFGRHGDGGGRGGYRRDGDYDRSSRGFRSSQYSYNGRGRSYGESQRGFGPGYRDVHNHGGGQGPKSRKRYGPPVRTNYRLIVENLSSHCSWQDLKDYMRQAGEVTFADAHKQNRNEGIVAFATYRDMENAWRKLDGTEIYGCKIKLVESKPA
ncbi:uncharacterized protein LOC144875346 [Branchiostoma floridae x Branchiostoma japonicum]